MLDKAKRGLEKAKRGMKTLATGTIQEKKDLVKKVVNSEKARSVGALGMSIALTAATIGNVSSAQSSKGKISEMNASRDAAITQVAKAQSEVAKNQEILDNFNSMKSQGASYVKTIYAMNIRAQLNAADAKNEVLNKKIQTIVDKYNNQDHIKRYEKTKKSDEPSALITTASIEISRDMHYPPSVLQSRIDVSQELNMARIGAEKPIDTVIFYEQLKAIKTIDLRIDGNPITSYLRTQIATPDSEYHKFDPTIKQEIKIYLTALGNVNNGNSLMNAQVRLSSIEDVNRVSIPQAQQDSDDANRKAAGTGMAAAGSLLAGLSQLRRKPKSEIEGDSENVNGASDPESITPSDEALTQERVVPLDTSETEVQIPAELFFPDEELVPESVIASETIDVDSPNGIIEDPEDDQPEKDVKPLVVANKPKPGKWQKLAQGTVGAALVVASAVPTINSTLSKKGPKIDANPVTLTSTDQRRTIVPPTITQTFEPVAAIPTPEAVKLKTPEQTTKRYANLPELLRDGDNLNNLKKIAKSGIDPAKAMVKAEFAEQFIKKYTADVENSDPRDLNSYLHSSLNVLKEANPTAWAKLSEKDKKLVDEFNRVRQATIAGRIE
jgi:hypothetical protein